MKQLTAIGDPKPLRHLMLVFSIRWDFECGDGAVGEQRQSFLKQMDPFVGLHISNVKTCCFMHVAFDFTSKDLLLFLLAFQ